MYTNYLKYTKIRSLDSMGLMTLMESNKKIKMVIVMKYIYLKYIRTI